MSNIKSLAQIASEIWSKQVSGMKVVPPGDEIQTIFSSGNKESLCQISSL